MPQGTAGSLDVPCQHASRRAPNSRQIILDATDSYGIVEAYPDDKYLPSYLLLGRTGDDVFHVLFGVDVVGRNVRVVTAYVPSPEEWEPDLKTRRRSL